MEKLKAVINADNEIIIKDVATLLLDLHDFLDGNVPLRKGIEGLKCRMKRIETAIAEVNIQTLTMEERWKKLQQNN